MEPTDNTDATLFLPLEMCQWTEEQNISPPFLSLPPSLSLSLPPPSPSYTWCSRAPAVAQTGVI